MAKILILCSLLGPALARARSLSSYNLWLNRQPARALRAIEDHFSPEDGLPGVVIASPERGPPDYYYHWVRDGALVMQTVLALGGEKGRHMLHDYASLAKIHQLEMAQPKFHVDGKPFTGEWCRPQNDGPALRAITLIQFADRLLADGSMADQAYVRGELYQNSWPNSSPIKVDLEFVAHHWRESTCDLWEETVADHFYTRMVQRRALVDGARLAEELGDPGAAAFYRDQAEELQSEILKHWDSSNRLFRTHLNFQRGEEKPDGIDSAVILGLLHGHTDDGFLIFTDPRVIDTVERLATHFEKLYPINQKPGLPGFGWGRYTSDTFNGERGGYGNPWFLVTAAAAQIHLLAAEEWLKRPGHLKAALHYFSLGDAFLKRIHYHAGEEDVLDEQFDRHTGFMTSAPDLTWSYKELADAIQVYQRVKARLDQTLEGDKPCSNWLSAGSGTNR
jgi:glucoamylase